MDNKILLIAAIAVAWYFTQQKTTVSAANSGSAATDSAVAAHEQARAVTSAHLDADTTNAATPAAVPFSGASFGVSNQNDAIIAKIEAAAPAVAFDNTKIDKVSGYTVGFNPAMLLGG